MDRSVYGPITMFNYWNCSGEMEVQFHVLGTFWLSYVQVVIVFWLSAGSSGPGSGGR